ncbi:MAG: Maf family protein [Methyloceanibacter sp.]|uniref:Maf family protein n=1 Tax=Methyloceanibacter sp. TaxID=1965321 RepID=UPI003D9B6FCB
MSSFLQGGRPPLILASSSKIRALLLEAAGLAFIVEPPGLDESIMRQAVGGERLLSPSDVAEVLARAKAEAVSDLARPAYVIGADQVLSFGDTVLSKPDSMEAARRQLLDLRGKSHTLHTSVALATNGATVWAETHTATLTMRKLSPEFIGRYLAAAGERVLSSVGAYQIESLGIQLFDRIEGDYFSILGLPLLPLLAALRREGVIEG